MTSQQVGSYRVIRELGHGGMGVVYLARRLGARGFERDVALKVIRAESPSERHVECFLREGRALAALNHRGVVRVFDLFAEGSALCLAMEYLPGINLRRLLARHGRLPWPAACYVGAEAARALEAAHSSRSEEAPQGLVHRDVSPTNIMLCNDGAVKLLDFGLARPVGKELSVSGIEGKLRYMPPEAAAGTGVGPGADVYALGVVLYELVTGQPPIAAENELALLNRIMNATVEPPAKLCRDLPPALDALVLRALSRDQQARPSAGELAAELEALAAGRFGPSHLAAMVAGLADGGPPSTTGRRRGRRRLWIATAALALLGGGAALLVAREVWGPAEDPWRGADSPPRGRERGRPQVEPLRAEVVRPSAPTSQPLAPPASQPARAPDGGPARVVHRTPPVSRAQKARRPKSKASKAELGRAAGKRPPDDEPINPFH